jgi:hypothetical protein
MEYFNTGCLYWPPLARDAGTLTKLLYIKGTT